MKFVSTKSRVTSIFLPLPERSISFFILSTHLKSPSRHLYTQKKQLKEIKITLTIFHFRNIFFISDRTTNMQLSKMQMKFTGQWLRYSTAPKVPK